MANLQRGAGGRIGDDRRLRRVRELRLARPRRLRAVPPCGAATTDQGDVPAGDAALARHDHQRLVHEVRDRRREIHLATAARVVGGRDDGGLDGSVVVGDAVSHGAERADVHSRAIAPSSWWW
jgi:hypothetical protein